MNTNGKLFLDYEIGVYNCITLYYIEEAGNKYIIFGHKNGIYGIELNSDGISVKNISNHFKLAGNVFDLPYIYKRNNFYYLFASIEDYYSKYPNKKIVVGRSNTLNGTYLSRNNGRMLDNEYELIIGGNKTYSYFGIISIVNDTWLIFHATNKKKIQDIYV